jgi:hypothetical protein
MAPKQEKKYCHEGWSMNQFVAIHTFDMSLQYKDRKKHQHCKNQIATKLASRTQSYDESSEIALMTTPKQEKARQKIQATMSPRLLNYLFYW